MISLKEVTFKDYPTFLPFFQNQSYRLCAYSLPSFIAWNNDELKPYGVVYKDALILGAEFTVKKENRHLLLPISPAMTYGPQDLYRLAEQAGYPAFWFVPDDYINQFDRDLISSYFIIKEQRPYFDYIYATDDLAYLKGNKYSKKRNLINQFNKTYGRKKNIRLEPVTSAQKEECLDFLEEWCEEYDCDEGEGNNLACEKQAIINTFDHIDIIDVKGIMLRMDGRINAFAVGAPLTKTMGVLHFQKAFAAVKGLYQFFDQLCAKELFAGYPYINKENDMNIPGLIKAKKSYHPTAVIKSYQLILK